MAKKKPPHPYRNPYLDSSVFIGWIKGEVIGGVDRGIIAEHVLTQAENGQHPIVISAWTLAEVHKKRGEPRLPKAHNDNLLKYFEHDFIQIVTVDRELGEEANRLCRKYEDEKLSPADAIHLAAALRAKCDVLLTWDGPLLDVSESKIRIEKPQRWEQFPITAPASEKEFNENENADPEAPAVRRSGDGPSERPAATEGQAEAEEGGGQEGDPGES